MARNLPDFINGWLEYTEPLPTPLIFRIWSAIGAMSCALGRRVWIKTNSRMPLCFPNLFLMLVAPPGIGKDVSINKVADLIITANAISKNGIVARLGGESISPKGLVDKLADNASKQTFTYRRGHEQVTAEFHSLTFCIGELGTAIPEYDPRLIPLLNDLYNNKPAYEDAIRGIEVRVPAPHLTLILGNQPNTLAEVFPERTFRMGFTSRIIFVYAHHPVIKDLYVDEEIELSWDQSLEQKLAEDFCDMASMAGPFKVTPETKKLINEFSRDKPAEVPGAKFQDYNTRRPLHAQKLAICASASESNSQVVEVKHWIRALELLFAAEAKMPQIFAEVTTARGFSETYEEIKGMGGEESEVTHRTLVRKLSRTHPPYEVKQILELARADGVLVPLMDEAGAERRPLIFRVDRG